MKLGLAAKRWSCRAAWRSKQNIARASSRRCYGSAAAQAQAHTQSSFSAAPPSPSSFARLGPLQDELDKLAPRFDICASQIHIIQSPEDFYNTLKVNSSFLPQLCFFFSAKLCFLLFIFFLSKLTRMSSNTRPKFCQRDVGYTSRRCM